MTVLLDMHENAAVFRHPPEHGRVAEELDDLVQHHHAGGVVPVMYLERLETLVARNPWFNDGHARLGLALYKQGETERALEAGMQGFSLESAPLPPELGTSIEWTHPGNRPLLRAARGVVLCWLLERSVA